MIRIASLVLFAFAPLFAFAQTGASLYFTPITSSADTGGELVVRVMINTAGQSINAADGRIVFDPKELAVERIDIDESIFSSWPTAPRYDNLLGEIVFGGSLAATTTYIGERGELFRVVFRGLRTGETRLRFDTGSAVLAGDGTGGNILAETKVGVYVFSPVETAPPNQSAPTPEFQGGANGEGEVLGAQIEAIVSSTHPDESVWSKERTASFQWSNSPSVVRVLTALSERSNGRGIRAFTPPISERTVEELPEGVWYFTVTQEFVDGSEKTLRYKLMIDATPPSVFEIREDDVRAKTDPEVRFFVSATDTLSGIDHIEFSLDGATPVRWENLSERTYALSGLAFGEHQLRAVAYDRAGNSLERTVKFTVDPLPSPLLTIENSNISEGDVIRISGTAMRGSTLRVYLTPRGGETSVRSVPVREDGTFFFESDIAMAPGVYTISADIVDDRGATSDRIAEETIVVSATVWGMISRHPMLLIAAFAGIVCLALLGFAVRRFLRGRDEEESPVEERHEVKRGNAPEMPHALHIPDGPVHMERLAHSNSHAAMRVSAAEVTRHPARNGGVVDLRLIR